MTNPRERLARYIRARRLALGLPVQRAAREAGIDRQTWIKAEAAERNIGDHTAAKIERELRWEPGSVDEIRRGGEPTDTPPEVAEVRAPPTEPGDDEHDRLVAEIARIKRLRVPAETRLAMLGALVDLWEERTAERDADGAAS